MQFCYLCGRKWKTCLCAKWDERRLLAMAAQRAGAPARRAQAWAVRAGPPARPAHLGYRAAPQVRVDLTTMFQALPAALPAAEQRINTQIGAVRFPHASLAPSAGAVNMRPLRLVPRNLPVAPLKRGHIALVTPPRPVGPRPQVRTTGIPPAGRARAALPVSTPRAVRQERTKTLRGHIVGRPTAPTPATSRPRLRVVLPAHPIARRAPAVDYALGNTASRICTLVPLQHVGAPLAAPRVSIPVSVTCTLVQPQRPTATASTNEMRQHTTRKLVGELRVNHDCTHPSWTFYRRSGNCGNCSHRLSQYLFVSVFFQSLGRC